MGFTNAQVRTVESQLDHGYINYLHNENVVDSITLDIYFL